MRNTSPRTLSAGFTLIEIMAVIVIIGLLSALVGVAIVDRIDQARVTAAKTQMKSLESALETYRMDNARYPTTEQGLEALVRKPSGDPPVRNYAPGGYLRGGSVPADPWGEPYQYRSPGERNRHFDLWSLGADSSPGGEGIDADLGNWASENGQG